MGSRALDSAFVLRQRLQRALGAMILVYALGSLGFYLLGGGRWAFGDCLYMTIVSLTTVGYAEILPGLQEAPYGRLFTGTLLVTGVAVTLYAVSVLTTFLVEGAFLDLRQRRIMRKRIDRLSEHVIVCGAGRTGSHIASELAAALWPYVVIDSEADAIERLADDLDDELSYIVGDATDDSVLLSAGIERAHGVIAALSADKDNLYVVVTTRQINPQTRIVAKAVDPRAVQKLEAAGANRVVSVNAIGGHRMASEMIRPHVVEFIETMIRDKDRNLRLEEVTIPDASPLVGARLADTDIRKVSKLLVVAAGDADNYTYSPGPDFVLRPGMKLIVLGETDSVHRLRQSPTFRS
jgi:voltage-gated potassium channel